MKTVTFLKEPGYTYDLLSIFLFYFNKEHYVAQMRPYGNIAEDTERINRMLDSVGKIPEELRAFFHVCNGETPVFVKSYYNSQIDHFLGEFSLQTMLDMLSDIDAVVDTMLRFYFPLLSAEDIAECKGSLAKIDKLLKQSLYEDSLKIALYSFFISPAAVVNTLCQELIKKEMWLAQYYEQHLPHVMKLKESFDAEKLRSDFAKCAQQPAELSEEDEWYVTFCLFNYNCIKTYFGQGAVLLWLGMNYQECMQLLAHTRDRVHLDMFGSALSEKNRVDILNYMYERGEVTIKDIEHEFGFTGTNTYYHLQMMIKAGMLKTRNRGRTVLYSINGQFFEVLCDVLKDYAKIG